MYKKINWKKGAFSTHYRLYSKDIEIGELIDKSFSLKAKASINGKSYRFETKGFFNKATDIFDDQTDTKIGTITYNNWKTSADIDITGQSKFAWKTNNSWKTSGTIYHNDIKLIEYKGFSNKGEITVNEYNDLLILTGLYVSNYFWQTMIVIFVAVFIPIWVLMN